MHEEPRVFISYSSDATPLLRQIEAEFREAGIETWVDHRRLRAGDNLPVEISEALSWCNVLLLIWSKSSSQSNWVKLEWTNAVALDKRIIPLLLDDTPLPSILSHKTYISSKDPEQRKSELLRALSKRPDSDGANVHDTWSQPKVEHSQKKLIWPRKPKQWLKPLGIVLALVAMVTFVIATVKYFTRADPGALNANSLASGIPSKGNADSHQKSTVLLMIVDFSPSLSPFQLQQVVNNANVILNGMPAGTSYEIYKLQANWNLARTLEAGTVQPLSDGSKIEEERTKRLEAAKNGELHFGRSSCLVDSLPFVHRFFKRYDPNEYQYELVYLSDMVEDCSSPLVDRKLTISNVQAKGLRFPEAVDLSDVHITAIIPTLEANPRPGTRPPALPELRALWKEIFKHCGLSEARLSKEEWFYFSTFLSDRFQAGRK